MRVLVATTAGAGHFAPLVPFAAALCDSGHAVQVAAPFSFAASVQRAGFDHLPFADCPAEEFAAVAARLPSLSMADANAMMVRDVFCGMDARAALPGMQAAIEQWQPDLILRETCEFASYVAAERLGIPHVQVSVSLASVEAFIQVLIDEPLRELGASSGAKGIAGAPRLTLVPSSLDDLPESESPRPYRFRLRIPSDSPELPRSWWPDARPPLVYVTFGSVAAGIGFFPDFYRAMLTALADLPVRILLTVGDAGDPERLSPLPLNVHVERWWPQEQVMAHAAAMVTHGGFTTTLLGLSSGLPMVVIPLFAFDQHTTAHKIQAVGAGIVLEDAGAATVQARSALERVLADSVYRTAALRLADEMARLPHPSACVPLLEARVRNK